MLASNDVRTNTVYVGHTANLKDGLGVWPKPEGVMAIFKKQGNKIIFKGKGADTLCKFGRFKPTIFGEAFGFSNSLSSVFISKDRIVLGSSNPDQFNPISTKKILLQGSVGISGETEVLKINILKSLRAAVFTIF